jgi:hypothetical protein
MSSEAIVGAVVGACAVLGWAVHLSYNVGRIKTLVGIKLRDHERRLERLEGARSPRLAPPTFGSSP